MISRNSIMSFIREHHRIVFFLTWFVINLVQAGTTGLLDDEAYYWVYSKFLDWGYFDHPPMIALLIRSGYFVFRNELGVRLLTVILSSLTLITIYHLLPRKNDRLFYAIACSFAVLQIGGMIAVPDLPLAFFVALFFLAYKKFITAMRLPQTLFLGVVMALLLYSKYHGVLIIIFTLFSNPRLVLKYQFYLAALIGALLFSPHLYWQYTHGFPSVEYHLFERNAPAYRFAFTVEYILGQIILPGPLMGWLFIWAAFTYKPADTFERALKFSLAGIYGLFLISTLKGRVEANWTVPVFIPLIILNHQYLFDKQRWQMILFRSVPVTLLLVLMARVYMMLDIIPVKFLKKDEFHKNKPWADSIYKHTGGLPVVFVNSYQKASKYWFYSGVPSFSLNTPAYRRNNYNYWPLEDSLYNKKLAVVSFNPDTLYKESISTPRGMAGMIQTDSFFSFSKVRILPGKQLLATKGYVRNYTLDITSEEQHLKAFQTEKLRYKTVDMFVMNENKMIIRLSTNIRLSVIRKIKQTFTTSFNINLPPDEYSARFAMPSLLETEPSLNSRTVKLVVR